MLTGQCHRSAGSTMTTLRVIIFAAMVSSLQCPMFSLETSKDNTTIIHQRKKLYLQRPRQTQQNLFISCLAQLNPETFRGMVMAEGSLDPLVKHVCSKITVLRDCLVQHIETSYSCENYRREVLHSLTDNILNFMCRDDGTLISSLIPRGSECISQIKEVLELCVHRDPVSSQSDDPSSTGNACSDSLLDSEWLHCRYLDQAFACAIEVLKDCDESSQYKAMEEIFNHVKRNTFCLKFYVKSFGGKLEFVVVKQSELVIKNCEKGSCGATTETTSEDTRERTTVFTGSIDELSTTTETSTEPSTISTWSSNKLWTTHEISTEPSTTSVADIGLKVNNVTEERYELRTTKINSNYYEKENNKSDTIECAFINIIFSSILLFWLMQ